MAVHDKAYLEQIDKYYEKKLKSHDLIHLGKTPKLLIQFGAPKLPIVMLQSTITKCIRKPSGSRSAHDLPRSIIESLPEQIRNPIFLIQDKGRNSISLISSMADKKNNQILIAIHLNEKHKEIQVNEVKSIYGKTNLKEYLEGHIEENQLNIIDIKKAEILSRVIGLQLPKALIASSYNNRIALQSPKVNKKKTQSLDFQGKGMQSIHRKLESFQKNINQSNGKGHSPAQTKQEYENR